MLVNAIALVGVVWNRSEPADSRLQLSERELSDSYSYWRWRNENNGIALRLDYRWPRNAGLRLDHLLLSKKAAKRLLDAGVDRDVRGMTGASDHAPAWIVLDTA